MPLKRVNTRLVYLGRDYWRLWRGRCSQQLRSPGRNCDGAHFLDDFYSSSMSCRIM